MPEVKELCVPLCVLHSAHTVRYSDTNGISRSQVSVFFFLGHNINIGTSFWLMHCVIQHQVLQCEIFRGPYF